MSDVLADNVFDDDDNKSWNKVKKQLKGKRVQDAIVTLHDAAAIGCISYVVAHWAAGFDVDEVDQFGASMLHWAAMKGQLPVLRFLAEHGADINRKDNNGQTPIMWAANENRVDCGKALLQYGADPKYRDPRGCNAYFIAAMCGSLAYLHMLHVNAGPIAPDDLDNEKHTLLVWAAYKGHLPVVRYLHEQHNISVIAIDTWNRNALHWAAREGQTECCVYLMSVGLSATQKDVEGLSPTEWAQRRNHHFTHAALARNQTTPTPTITGTLTSMTSHVDVLLHALVGVAAIVAHFMLLTRFIPTVFSHIIVTIYGSKNMLFPLMRKPPITTASETEQKSLLDDAGVPKTLVEAMRGIAAMPFRRRESMNVTMFPCFLCVQYIALNMAGITISPLYFATLSLAALFGFLVKMLSFRDIVPRGSALEDPLLKAVEAGDLRSAQESRIYPPGYYARIPLRAYHCFELDAYLYRYDGWCLYFDCPIAKSNRRFYFLFVCFMFFNQALVLFQSWNHFFDLTCTAEQPFRLCSFFWNIFVSALPCKETPADDSWLTYVLPSTTNTLGLWLLQYTFAMTVIFFVTAWRHTLCIFYGTSRKEFTEQVAPCTTGGLTSIMRNKGVIFSDGGPGLNTILFFLGRDGKRWEGVGAIPPAPPS